MLILIIVRSYVPDSFSSQTQEQPQTKFPTKPT